MLVPYRLCVSILSSNEVDVYRRFYCRSTKILLNSLHGVTGPYCEAIFGDELGAPRETSFMKTQILPDFGGGHPDPNLTYASDLVRKNK